MHQTGFIGLKEHREKLRQQIRIDRQASVPYGQNRRARLFLQHDANGISV
jgi:hypothetical protein